ncbi:MAG: acyl-CoA thioester hydrolase [Oceanicoccus sp.]|jgi:acyl-CoA thioester hydrolase
MERKGELSEGIDLDTTFEWDFPDPFLIPMTVQETDIDSYGHANNSVYVRWFDQCARTHSKSVGVDTENATALGFGMAVKESAISYNASAYLGDHILVANWLTANDFRLRATRHFQIIRSVDGLTLARADMDYVCINIATGRPSRMPVLFKEKYAPV